MKTKESIEKSSTAALNRAITECDNVKRDLLRLWNGGSLQDVMPRLRRQAEEMVKGIHEFNAYENTLGTN